MGLCKHFHTCYTKLNLYSTALCVLCVKISKSVNCIEQFFFVSPRSQIQPPVVADLLLIWQFILARLHHAHIFQTHGFIFLLCGFSCQRNLFILIHQGHFSAFVKARMWKAIIIQYVSECTTLKSSLQEQSYSQSRLCCAIYYCFVSSKIHDSSVCFYRCIILIEFLKHFEKTTESISHF